jgi:hypothetical protein
VTVTIPPREPELEDERSVEERIAELEALIKEARRRARRRRAAYAAVALVALAGVVAGANGIGGGVDVDASVAPAQGSPASATNTSRTGPPTCSPAGAQRPGSLVYSETRFGGSYLRYCGSGRAVMRVGRKSFTIEGGRCLSSRVGFGVLGDGISGTPAARAFWGPSRAKGFSLVLERLGHNRPGRNDVIDGIVQLPGVSLAGPITGTAIVGKGLESATFSIGTPGRPARITASWTCGSRF